MADAALRTHAAADAVAAYKQILASVLERRPSGTRQKLAAALARNRSFVSQITNPVYATPVPATHLATIFDVCHFSKSEQRAFMDLYELAHPGRVPSFQEPQVRHILLPDLGDESRNARLHAIVTAFISQLAGLLDTTNAKGKRR